MMAGRLFLFVTACSVVLVLAGCDSMQKRSDPASAVWETVTSIEWRLDLLDGRTPITAGEPVTLRLKRFGVVEGYTGINRYGGSYERGEDGRVRFSKMQVTLRAMPDPPGLMEQETRYMALLERVTGYRVLDGRLLLLSNGETVLEFVPSPAG